VNKFQLGTLTFSLGLVVSLFFAQVRHDSHNAIAATSSRDSATATGSSRWEYYTTAADTVSLGAKLTAMGIDGWEVVSVVALKSDLPNDQNVLVVAKRKRAN
jgi:hypothetical protein